MNRGDVRFWQCGNCRHWKIPVDTRIKRKQQVCKCLNCGTIYKYTYKGPKSSIGIKWHMDWQGDTKVAKKVQALAPKWIIEDDEVVGVVEKEGENNEY